MMYIYNTNFKITGVFVCIAICVIQATTTDNKKGKW